MEKGTVPWDRNKEEPLPPTGCQREEKKLVDYWTWRFAERASGQLRLSIGKHRQCQPDTGEEVAGGIYILPPVIASQLGTFLT